MHSFIPQFIATLGATFGAFSLGNVIAWPSSALLSLTDDIALSSNDENWTVSIFMLGAALVPWLAAVTFPIIGKKWSLVALAIPFIGGWFLLCFAQNVAMLLIGRFLTGFAGGAFVLAAPAYSSEIAETKYRGALGTVMQLMVTLGILFINVNCSTNWKVLSGVCIIFPGILAGWMIFMPRSPIFLVSKGNVEGARKSLQWLRGRKDVDEELKTLQENVQDNSLCGVPLMSLFTKKQYAKPLGIVLVLMALQQLSGINYVLSYSAPIFKSAGTNIDECLSTMLIGAIQVLGTFVTTLIIDKFGRKVLLLISDFLICVSMIGVGVFFALSESCKDCEETGGANSTTTTTTMAPELMVSQATVDSVGFLPLVSLMVFIAAFSLGFGPVPWILNVELIPPEARAISSSLCTMFNWLISFLVALLVPIIGDAIGSAPCYFIFSGIALLGTIFIFFFVPETKGKTEDEIRKYFS